MYWCLLGVSVCVLVIRGCVGPGIASLCVAAFERQPFFLKRYSLRGRSSSGREEVLFRSDSISSRPSLSVLSPLFSITRIGCYISGMDDHRKVGFPGKFHLPSEPVTLCVLHLRLFIPVIIQSDLTDRNGLWKRCLLF